LAPRWYIPLSGCKRPSAANFDEPKALLAALLSDDDAVFHVRDSGVGIAAEMLPRVFDLFTQIDRSLDRAEGGLGIGLTLVHRLVEMHGGTVQAFSDGLGRGSEFVVRLPTAPAPAPCVIEPSLNGKHSVSNKVGGLRILVVDDNRDSAHSLALLLEIQGHEVQTAYDGLAALETVEAFDPDAVVLDIGLPRLDGYEAARRIRARPRLKPLLLVALTGYGHEENRLQAQAAGFDHHLVKPVDLDVLQQLFAAHHQLQSRGQGSGARDQRRKLAPTLGP